MADLIHPGFVWTYPAQVQRVVDGDTVECHVQFSPLEVHDAEGVNVRVEGINALELKERFGGEAKAFAEGLLPVGSQVVLIARRREKYGRFLAHITLPDGSDFSAHMLAALASDGVTHLAVPLVV